MRFTEKACRQGQAFRICRAFEELAEKTGEKGYKGDTDKGNAAASHKLLHTL